MNKKKALQLILNVNFNLIDFFQFSDAAHLDPPIVTLRLGSTLSDDIKEGDDVYFECHATANPQWRKLYWLHDVSMTSMQRNDIRLKS